MALPLRALLFLLVLASSAGCGASVHGLVREGRWRDAHERARRSDDAETRRVYAEAEVQARRPHIRVQTRLSRSDVCEATASGGRCTRWEVLEPAVTRDSPGPDALTIGWVSSIDTPVSWEVPVTESQLATGVDAAYPR